MSSFTHHFQHLLEAVMSVVLEELDGKVSKGGRNITNLRFADDIDGLADEEQQLEALVESLDKTCTRKKMEISVEKTKTNDKQRQKKIEVKSTKAWNSYKFQVPCFK